MNILLAGMYEMFSFNRVGYTCPVGVEIGYTRWHNIKTRASGEFPEAVSYAAFLSNSMLRACDCFATDPASVVQRLVRYSDFTRVSSSAEAAKPLGQTQWRRLLQK